MNIFIQLTKLTKLTQNEKILVDYILHNPIDIIKKNAKQISQDSYVSVSTIYRLCKKLEVSGLTELKVQLSMQLDDYKKEDKSLDYNYPFKKNETQYQILTKMLELYNQTLTSTYNLIDNEKFRLALQELINAKRISIFPSSGNLYMAESFQSNMQEIGTIVQLGNTYYDQHWLACSMSLGDVVIVISYAARTPGIKEVVKTLKKQKAKIILISAIFEESISKYVDHHLYFSSYENSEEKIASFSSRISLQYLLDCLYACYFNRNYENHLQYKIDNYID